MEKLEVFLIATKEMCCLVPTLHMEERPGKGHGQ